MNIIRQWFGGGESARSHFRRGLRHFHAHEFEPAEAALRKVIAIEPNHKESLAVLGQIFLVAHRDQEAADALEKASRLFGDTTVPELYRLLALAYGLTRAHDKSIAAFRNALRLDPDHVETHTALILGYGDAGRYDDVRAAVHAVTQLKPAIASLTNVILLLSKQLMDAPAVWKSADLEAAMYEIVRLYDDALPAMCDLPTAKTLVTLGTQKLVAVPPRSDAAVCILPFFLGGIDRLRAAGARVEAGRSLRALANVCLHVGWYPQAGKAGREALELFGKQAGDKGERAECDEILRAAKEFTG